MNPDAIIAALRQELEGCTDPERKTAIHAEIKSVDGQERPPIIVDSSQLEVGDFSRGYLDGLRDELEKSGKERAKEIKAEIARVELALKARIEPQTSEEEPVPTEQEIEERKQTRTQQGVEQARSAPVPGQAPPATNVPAQGAEEKKTDE